MDLAATWRLCDAEGTRRVVQDADGLQMTLVATALAPFCALQADLPGRFSDTAFGLIPGQDRVISFVPASPGTPTVTLNDLPAARIGI